MAADTTTTTTTTNSSSSNNITGQKKRVAIVGAGASGIPACKEALAHGLEPVVFEASTDIGGLWRYKPQETDEGTVMKTTVINTSKEMTAYSTFTPPAHYGNFMHNRYMLDYLRLFAASFDFHKYVRLQHAVVDVRRAAEDSYERDGKWLVTYRTPDGQMREEMFDAVLLCTGHHTQPYLPPAWPGQEHFKGKIMHAHSYKNQYGYDDQTVVVVGVGNSGVDVAVELSHVAKQVYLVTRRGTWVLYRNLDHSVPFDLPLNSRWTQMLFHAVPSGMAAWYIQRCFERRLAHDKYGLKPAHGILSAHLTVNDELPNRLCAGLIRVRPNIRAFTADGEGVIFEDGTVVPHVDKVILATGYSFGFPLLESGTLIPVHENDVTLYKYMFPPDLHAHNTLAVIGLIQPLGSIMPIAELQCRLFFEAFTGTVKLPGRREMLEDIECKKAEIRARYVQSRRHTIQVDYVDYMDQLAMLIGCMPQIRKYAFTDLTLFRALIFGPNTPYVYRLDGPGKWDGARAAILSVDQRVEAGMRGVPLAEDNNNCNNMDKQQMLNGVGASQLHLMNGNNGKKSAASCSSSSCAGSGIVGTIRSPLFAFIISLCALAVTLWFTMVL